MEPLKTDYKNYSFFGNKKFNVINNDDGSVSFEDVTEYSVIGDEFGADDLNATNQRVNEMNIIKDYNQFTNKPSVNNVILEGNKTLDDLGIQPKQIITNLSNIGITVSSSTVLSDILSAVPNNSVLNVYLNNEQAEFLYNNADIFGNLPSDKAGVLTIQKWETANITIRYETIYLYKDPTIYYTTCIGTEFRQWSVVSHGEKVLWSNPNPSGLVDGTYVINLSSSDYDELRWIFTYSNTTDNQFSTNCLKGQNIMVVTIGYNNTNLIRRIIDYVSPTQYKCRNARYGVSDSAEHIIPIAVIGIKR